MRRLASIAFAVLALAAPVSAPGAQAPLQLQLDRALAVPHIDPARSGVLTLDLKSGAVAYSHNATLSLAPASTEKLPLGYALLVRLGPMYRIRTEVYGTGQLEGAVWRGDLVVKGYGDPTLSKWGLKALARQVAATGVRRVTGLVVADESYFDPLRVGPGWKPAYYIEESPPLSALVVDRAHVGSRVSTNPALAAADKLRAFLQDDGVAVSGGVGLAPLPAGATLLARRSSPPLATILRTVLGDSDNFGAEMLLKHLGAVARGEGTSARGAAVVMDVLRKAGIPLTGVRLADGSGLSLLDRLTARTLAGVLLAAWRDPVLRGIMLSTLAVSGQRGTLEDRLRGPALAGKVVAKTGTTSRASALAGYVNGRYVFAVVNDGSPIAWTWARKAQDRFVTVLAKTP